MILEVFVQRFHHNNVVMEGGILYFLKRTYGRECCTPESFLAALTDLKQRGFITEHLVIGGATDWRILKLPSILGSSPDFPHFKNEGL